MTEKRYYLAIDIGASSGRHIVGFWENGLMRTDEVYRFANGPERCDKGLIWNVEKLFSEIKNGIKKAFERYRTIRSIAIDTWGVDYVLMRGENPVSPCYCYRDDRTETAVKAVHKEVDFNTLYQKTGIQFQPFNSVYQLYADKLAGRLDGVTDFLMLPEYFSYKLTGIKKKEYTEATTTGLINAKTKAFDFSIIEKLGLPAKLFTELSMPCATVGDLLPQIATEVGGTAKVIFCASHDTASAVEGVPSNSANPYISSGTWSLLGIKSVEPICNENSLETNFSNEGGVGYIRYQKTVVGMWILNRLAEENRVTAETLSLLAENSEYSAVIDVNHRAFVAPQSMTDAIKNRLQDEDKPSANTLADLAKCVLLSLANSYAQTIEQLQSNTKQAFEALDIVGGGAKNRFLNRLTERLSGLKVNAYPIEATALGNLKIQSMADGATAE